jgi:hypothetical protein
VVLKPWSGMKRYKTFSGKLCPSTQVQAGIEKECLGSQLCVRERRQCLHGMAQIQLVLQLGATQDTPISTVWCRPGAGKEPSSGRSRSGQVALRHMLRQTSDSIHPCDYRCRLCSRVDVPCQPQARSSGYKTSTAILITNGMS